MSRRLSVTLPDEVIEMIEARARASGKSKSEVVRDLLASKGLMTREERIERHAKAMKLAAEARAGQTEESDAAALIRESRDEMESGTDRLASDCDE